MLHPFSKNSNNKIFLCFSVSSFFVNFQVFNFCGSFVLSLCFVNVFSCLGFVSFILHSARPSLFCSFLSLFLSALFVCMFVKYRVRSCVDCWCTDGRSSRFGSRSVRADCSVCPHCLHFDRSLLVLARSSLDVGCVIVSITWSHAFVIRICC